MFTMSKKKFLSEKKLSMINIDVKKPKSEINAEEDICFVDYQTSSPDHAGAFSFSFFSLPLCSPLCPEESPADGEWRGGGQRFYRL